MSGVKYGALLLHAILWMSRNGKYAFLVGRYAVAIDVLIDIDAIAEFQ